MSPTATLWSEELDGLTEAADALLSHLWNEHPHTSGELARLSRVLGDRVAATNAKGLKRYYARTQVRGQDVIAYAFSEAEAASRLNLLLSRAWEDTE